MTQDGQDPEPAAGAGGSRPGAKTPAVGRFGRIYRMANGRYRAGYVHPPGVRHTAPDSFTTRAEAQAWLDAQQTRLDAQQARPVGDGQPVTFARFAADWLARQGLLVATRREHEIALHAHLLPVFGSSRLDQIGQDQVRDWLDSWGKRRLGARGYAYSVLRRLMAAAAAEGIIETNPCPRRRRPGRTPPPGTAGAAAEAGSPPHVTSGPSSRKNRPDATTR